MNTQQHVYALNAECSQRKSGGRASANKHAQLRVLLALLLVTGDLEVEVSGESEPCPDCPHSLKDHVYAHGAAEAGETHGFYCLHCDCKFERQAGVTEISEGSH